MASFTPVFGVLALLLAGPAWSQQSPMPEEIEWKLQEIGSVVDLRQTAAIYAPLQQVEPYAGVKVERDAKYGPADLNTLDIFTPDEPAKSATRPVLMFVHSGGFVGGDKHGVEKPFYDNVMLWAVKNGFVGVNVNYRLAPQSVWPSGPEDMAAAVKWVNDNIGKSGGDPARVYLMGHSAGAVHVASYVAHPEFYKVKSGGLAGAIMLSGIYQFGPNPEGIYFGDKPELYAERSSLQGLLKTPIPLMITAAELDPPRFQEQFNLVKDAACKRASGCAHTFVSSQHSHMSEVYSINTADSRLTDDIMNFIKAGK